MADKPYTIDKNGRIVFDGRRQEAIGSMFLAAGIDIDSIRTETDYNTAFSQAGDYFFGRLRESAMAGHRPSIDILRSFLEGRVSVARALAARQTFEVIESGQGVPRRSS